MEHTRKYSRKREAILECLRSTQSHPSADWVYSKLKPQYPDLSLATVYRNLAMFKRDGVIGSVGTVNGLERFDYDTRPHAHFVCSRCSAVLDVEEVAQLSDVIAANVLQKLEDRQHVLEQFEPIARLEEVCAILARETELAGIEKKVQQRVKKQIEKNQKD